MAHDMKFLARCPTPATDASRSGKTTGRLPIEMISEQVRRLAIFSAVIGVLWTYGLLMDLVVVPVFLKHLGAQGNHGAGAPIDITAILVSAATWAYMRFAPHSPNTKTTVGLGYMI